eukprot:TRINITY_DN2772_c0_g1_i1.p1 TRINITY_DN2772_c0_g1~~TRINITY_DN2772_c0_g1_i1.p1  ORF type:complete len:646 (+),score=193.40 TRINITY_DN2772_c0_g1_i1:558-2495(+)
MGGCVSNPKVAVSDVSQRDLEARSKPEHGNGRQEAPVQLEDVQAYEQASDPSIDFQEFRAEDLIEATGNFREANCLSTKGQAHHVYKGTLKDGRQVAVKKYQKRDWPTVDQFVLEASQVGRVRFPSLIPLIGYAHDATLCFLVAEFLPNKTLFKHLFHWETTPLTWVQRLAAAVTTAQTMHHLRAVEGIFIYHELTADRVIFGADGLPRLSCFGLIRPPVGTYSSNLSSLPPEYFSAGVTHATAESVVWNYGNLLLALISGKSIRPKQFLELVNDTEKLEEVIDSSLRAEKEKVLEVVPLCVDCLNEIPNKRPDFAKILLELIGASDIQPAVKGSSRYGPIHEEREVDEYEGNGVENEHSQQETLKEREDVLQQQQQQQQKQQQEQQQQQRQQEQVLISQPQQQQQMQQQEHLFEQQQEQQQQQQQQQLLQQEQQQQKQEQQQSQHQNLKNHLEQHLRQEERKQQQPQQVQQQPAQKAKANENVKGEVREGAPKMSRLGRAVAQNNMAVVHECLVAEKYGSPVSEATFGDWDTDVTEMQKARTAGDDAFKKRKWEEAIAHYTAFGKLHSNQSASSAPLPLLFARRCFCLMQTGELQNALTDAIAAGQRSQSRWSTAFYLQAALLKKLDLEADAKEAMEKGAACER